MELPRKILIGDGVISCLSGFVQDIGCVGSKIAFVTGRTVKKRAGTECESSFKAFPVQNTWHIVEDSSVSSVLKLKRSLSKEIPDLIIAIGGGRAVDVAKMTAFHLNKPFISVPTSASHDGIASPFVSIRGSTKPFSIKAKTPLGVLADTSLLAEAPVRLMASGCGDLVAKITATKDWELARDENNEYFGSYAANLACMSAKIILNESKELRINKRYGIRIVVEALISAGVAACIAGSSRPCSGSEHLFSHAVEYLVGQNYGLHGERVGLGTIMMAKLHNADWELIMETLESVGAPTKAKQISLSEEQVVNSLIAAQTLRPDRYTILSRAKLDRRSAFELAKSVQVI
jgi:glycerol-1-phosphate dehydrogenase [NAD(P)+]